MLHELGKNLAHRRTVIRLSMHLSPSLCARVRAAVLLQVSRRASGWDSIAGKIRQHFQQSRLNFSIFQLILDAPELLLRAFQALIFEAKKMFRMIFPGRITQKIYK
jgi:hypothetical protein